MSEEKIIKTILHHCEDCDLREYQTCNNCINDFKEAIKGLLDLYEQEKEKREDQKKIINKMAEQLTTPIHSKEWVIKHFEKEV